MFVDTIHEVMDKDGDWKYKIQYFEDEGVLIEYFEKCENGEYKKRSEFRVDAMSAKSVFKTVYEHIKNFKNWDEPTYFE